MKFGLCLMTKKNYLNQHLSLTKSTGPCFTASLMSNVRGSSKVVDSAMASERERFVKRKKTSRQKIQKIWSQQKLR